VSSNKLGHTQNIWFHGQRHQRHNSVPDSTASSVRCSMLSMSSRCSVDLSPKATLAHVSTESRTGSQRSSLKSENCTANRRSKTGRDWPVMSATRHLPATVQLRNADDSSGTQQPSRIDIEQNVALKRSWAFSKQQRTQLPFQLSPFRQASRKCIPLFVPGHIFTERFCAAIIAKRGREISAVCSRCD
jgi:hypothetical protein